MATIQERNGSYRILFVYHGKRETFTLGKVPPAVASAKAAKVDETLALLKSGYIGVPIVDFVEREGKPPAFPEAADEQMKLGSLRQKYLQALRDELLIAGSELKAGKAVDARIAELRAMYEPFLHALANHFQFALPPFSPATRRRTTGKAVLDAPRYRHRQAAHARKRRAFRLSAEATRLRQVASPKLRTVDDPRFPP